ncbi:MAG: hypothetical protein ABH884_01540, partial [Candidatus Komeilibacteria bacterium]
MKKVYLIILIIIIASGGLAFFIWQSAGDGRISGEQEQEVAEETTTTKKIEIIDGSTYGVLMDSVGINATTSQAIFEASEDIYDLSRIRLGRTLDIVYDKKSG